MHRLEHHAPARASMMTDRDDDFYATLGVSREAAREEIERGYKRLAREHHPDRGGDEEQMKAINEAWRVLGDAAARHDYDARRPQMRQVYQTHAPVTSHAAQADAVYGRIAGAGLCLGAGLALIFLVRFHYVVFLWPLALLGGLIALFGVLMAHGALVFARERMEPAHPARRFVWAQEVAFWSGMFGGAVVVVYLITMI